MMEIINRTSKAPGISWGKTPWKISSHAFQEIEKRYTYAKVRHVLRKNKTKLKKP